MTGAGSLTLTGQLGDVMKESAQAAPGTRSKADNLGIPANFLEKTDIHIHFGGSIPKDGPSAGVTILTALVSLLTGNRVLTGRGDDRRGTLRGLVLPVGGIKEKVLAAHRAGIKRIIIPARNERDLVDVPEQARKELEFVFAAHMDEVLKAALEEDPIEAGARRPSPRARRSPLEAKKLRRPGQRPDLLLHSRWSGSRSSPARPAPSRTPSRRSSGAPASPSVTRSIGADGRLRLEVDARGAAAVVHLGLRTPRDPRRAPERSRGGRRRRRRCVKRAAARSGSSMCPPPPCTERLATSRREGELKAPRNALERIRWRVEQASWAEFRRGAPLTVLRPTILYGPTLTRGGPRPDVLHAPPAGPPPDPDHPARSGRTPRAPRRSRPRRRARRGAPRR